MVRIYAFVNRNSQKIGILNIINIHYNFRGEIRVYTTDVLVVWPNDADHPKSEYPRGWFTQEDKEDLIFIKEDPAWLVAWKKLPLDLSSRYGAETRYENELGYNMDGRWFTPSNPLPLYGSIAERQQESMMMGSPPWATMVDMPAGLSALHRSILKQIFTQRWTKSAFICVVKKPLRNSQDYACNSKSLSIGMDTD